MTPNTLISTAGNTFSAERYTLVSQEPDNSLAGVTRNLQLLGVTATAFGVSGDYGRTLYIYKDGSVREVGMPQRKRGGSWF